MNRISLQMLQCNIISKYSLFIMKITTLLLSVVLVRSIQIGSGMESVDPEWYDSFEMKNYKEAFSVIYSSTISGETDSVTYHQFIYLGNNYYHTVIEKPELTNKGDLKIIKDLTKSRQDGFDGDTYWKIDQFVLSTVDARNYPKDFDILSLLFNKNTKLPERYSESELAQLKEMAARLIGANTVAKRGIHNMPLNLIKWDRVNGLYQGTNFFGHNIKVEIEKVKNRIPIELSVHVSHSTNTWNSLIELKYENAELYKHMPSYIRLHSDELGDTFTREYSILMTDFLKNPKKIFSYDNHLFPGVVKVIDDGYGNMDRDRNFNAVRDSRIYFAGHWIPRKVITHLYWALIGATTFIFALIICWRNLSKSHKQ